MSFSQSATSEKRIRATRPAGSPLVVKWPALLSVLQSIFRQLGGWQLQIDGADSMRTDSSGGIQAKISPGTGTAAPQGLDVSSDGTVVAAKVMDVMPKIGSTRLDEVPAPTLSIPTDGTTYVVINVSGTFDITDSTFVNPTFTEAPTVTITPEETDPGYAGTHSVSTGEFHFLLATFVDGVKTSQNGHGPISAEICDTLKSEAKANLNLTWASS